MQNSYVLSSCVASAGLLWRPLPNGTFCRNHKHVLISLSCFYDGAFLLTSCISDPHEINCLEILFFSISLALPVPDSWFKSESLEFIVLS